MKTKWIVENFTKESSYLEIVEAIKKEGGDIKEINNGFKFSDLEGYDENSPVMFLGSIEMTNTAFKQMPNCFPVAYCNQKNYLCTKYMSHFGKYLFNDKYSIISLKEFHRHKFFYYGVFGNEALIFIRPDSGQKLFQAQLLDLLDCDRFLEHNKHIEHELVVISCPKNIIWEGRFVVSTRKDIVANSTYRYQGQITKIPSVPVGATKLVKELLEIGYYPDSVFVMDICQDNDNNFWLLELNSFSSAGMYACNKTDIVKYVSNIAEEEWVDWKQNFTYRSS